MQPIGYIDENTPPEILNLSADPETTILLEREDQKIWVVLNDDHPELIEYTWILQYEGIIPDPNNFGNGSEVVFDPDPDLDGLELECEIVDKGLENYLSDTIHLRWWLEVL